MQKQSVSKNSYAIKSFPYETDPRCEAHGPTDELVQEMRDLAREEVC